MPQVLKNFKFSGSGGRSSHDWTKLLDGKIYQLERGKDYACKDQTFKSLARMQASKHGVSVQIQTVENGIVIQAVAAEESEAGE